ncbi:MAG: hypothetical protein ABUK01_10725 [Leptospirales bacterium]
MFIIRFFFFVILFLVVYAVIRILILVLKAKNHIKKNPPTRGVGQEKDVSSVGKVVDEKWLDED